MTVPSGHVAGVAFFLASTSGQKQCDHDDALKDTGWVNVFLVCHFVYVVCFSR